MSDMLFDHCAQCRLCCHIDPGYPPLEVTLNKEEKKRHGTICIESNCKNLSPTGCTLGDDKPFSCKLYPLSYNPRSRKFFYDSSCPLMPTYLEQLDDSESDATRHLSAMTATVLRLEKTDLKFLKKNHAVDVDYFDLEELPKHHHPTDTVE
jgi:Fe-S-cluster containining protein